MLQILEFQFYWITLFLIPILYWYLTRNYNYWSKQGIPGPPPYLLFGNFLDRLKDNLGIIDVQYMKKYGNVYGLFNGTSPVLQIAEPGLIKKVLVEEFPRFNNRRELRTEHPIFNKILSLSRSDDWKRLRNITSSTFASGKVKNLYTLVKQSVDEYVENLEEMAKSGHSFDVKKMHENLALDVIASCAFATKTNAIKDPNNPFVINTRKVLDIKLTQMIPSFIFPKFINNLLNVRMYVNQEASELLTDVARQIIIKRRQSGEKSNDFLQLLIDAKVDDSKRGDVTDGLQSHYFSKDEVDTSLERKTNANKFLNEDEVIAQCSLFLMAGFDTPSSTMAYMSYQLALNPELQEKLYKEVVTAMDGQQEISYEDLNRLLYLDACVSETLRLYPPVTRLEREVNQDFILPDSGIRLFEGQLVEIPVYAIHHSENYYKDPEKFIPDRFLAGNRDQLIPYTYLPFGAGPRNCVGMRFALMEVKLAMVHIITKFRFIKTEETEEKFRFKIVTPLLTPDSVTLAIEKR